MIIFNFNPLNMYYSYPPIFPQYKRGKNSYFDLDLHMHNSSGIAKLICMVKVTVTIMPNCMFSIRFDQVTQYPSSPVRIVRTPDR